MNDVSTFRLYVMRAGYLFIAIGLGLMIWPGILAAPADLSHGSGVIRALLGAVGLLAALGIRYPVQMVPLLLFELVWKTIWVLAFGLPLWLRGALDGAYAGTMFDNGVGLVILCLVMPWGHVYRNYVVRAAEPWRRARSTEGPGAMRAVAQEV